MNALLYDLGSGNLYDYCGGVADCAARQLRSVQAPVEALAADPARILRALRLSARARAGPLHGRAWPLVVRGGVQSWGVCGCKGQDAAGSAPVRPSTCGPSAWACMAVGAGELCSTQMSVEALAVDP